MALFLYNLILLIFSPLIYLFLLYRLSKGKEDGARWGERWGQYDPTIAEDKRSPRIWVHAVSVGEVMAAVPVLRELRKRYPDALIVLSTTTIGGREVALARIPPADFVVYFPLDYAFTVKRALASARPDVVLLMEWEIWPNFLNEAKKRGATIAVLNGRVSDKGFRRGKKVGFFTEPGLAVVDRFVMQSEEDARRAVIVGAAQAKVSAVGNTKFDESAALLTDDERDALRDSLHLPAGAPVLVCGSTRNAPNAPAPDEEVLLADAILRLRERFPNLAVILAPRHLERTDHIEAVLQDKGLAVVRRSTQPALTPGPSPNSGRGESRGTIPVPESETSSDNSDSPLPELGEGPGVRAGILTQPSPSVLLLDTFGELAKVYAVADVAFIGGSLVKQGGQSVFQPLAQGVPAVFGPHMNNQRDIAALAQATGVGFMVQDGDELVERVTSLLERTQEEKAAMVQQARNLIEQNQGVTARCLEVVEAAWKGKSA